MAALGGARHRGRVHSFVSIGLPLQESVSGAFNVYSLKPYAFDEDTVILAETFAGYAAVAMANACLYDGPAALTGHLTAAMGSRALIEQAKGVIMAERRCPADEVFAVLAKVAEYSHREIHDVAAALVDSAVHRADTDPSPAARLDRWLRCRRRPRWCGCCRARR
jgi:hypothetical protein